VERGAPPCRSSLGRLASDITQELVEDFISAKSAVGGSKREKALADRTIKVNLPTLRMILDYCVLRWLAANPLGGEVRPLAAVKAEVSRPENTEGRCPLFTDVRVS